MQELGLTQNEGKVYKILVEFGKLGANVVSSKSGVPYGRVYDVLASLIQKGLVIVIPEKTKKFAPGDPKSLLKIIDEKKKVLDKATETVKELKQFYEKKEKSPVVLAEGVRGFWKMADEMKKSEKYGYSIQWTAEIRPESISNLRKSIKKGIEIKSLVRYDKETKKNVDKRLKIDNHYRILENEGFAMHIGDDEEVLLGLIKNNTTLLIRDKSFAKVMKKLFLAYYNQAEKIK